MSPAFVVNSLTRRQEAISCASFGAKPRARGSAVAGWSFGSVPIPPLGANGRLPPGSHAATVAELELSFVTAFPTSSRRATLFASFTQLRQTLLVLVPMSSQWVDGSYVTSKVDPADIDVISVIDGLAFDALPDGTKAAARVLLLGHMTRDSTGCDSFAIMDYPANHPSHLATVHARLQWTKLWAIGRDGYAKGYVELL
jgi:hypothetical protein